MKSVKTDADTIVEFESSPERVRQIMESVGSKIGNVTYVKRSTGKLRKHSYRMGVRNPKYAKPPSSGNSYRKADDVSKDLITIYSTNDVVRDSEGNIIGRGMYRRIPLDGIIRIVAGGRVYEIQREGIVA